MSEVLGLLLGTGLGLVLSLVPGLHPALALALIVAAAPASWSGFTACLIVAAAGAALYGRHLSAVYNASATEAAASEPALALTAAGEGALALRTMLWASDVALAVVTLLALPALAALLMGLNVVKGLDTLLGPVGGLAIAWWCWAVCARSREPKLTALALLVFGAFGYLVLHHPLIVGDSHALAPIMIGCFTLPIALQGYGSEGMPDQYPARPVTADSGLALVGAAAGVVTGFLAGLGAGSIVSALQALADSACERTALVQYLLMSTAAAVANDALAIVLLLTAFMGRSGEAAILGKVLHQPGPAAALTLTLAMLLAAAVGRRLVLMLEPWYQRVLARHPPQRWIQLVLGLAACQLLLMMNPVIGLVFTLAGGAISLWARQQQLPQQVVFAALALPVLGSLVSL